MRPYKELRWPRFWPFLRIKDEMPSHRINLTWRSWWLACVALLLFHAGVEGDGGMIFSVLSGILTGAYISACIEPIRLFPAPPRKASNYGVSIVIRRDVLENEPHVLQQEIYESRYWLRHPWRLVDFFWFYKTPSVRAWILACRILHPTWHRVDANDYRSERRRKAAAHLASVECQSRAQEIRAWSNQMHDGCSIHYTMSAVLDKARQYARSIHGAGNYPFIKAAGWDEERVYQEIVRNL